MKNKGGKFMKVTFILLTLLSLMMSCGKADDDSTSGGNFTLKGDA